MPTMTEAQWRYEHGVGPEPRRWSPPVWSCPHCGSDLMEADGGMRCPACGRHWTWAELRDSDDND